MSRRTVTAMALIVLAAFINLPGAVAQEGGQPAPRDGLLIHISHGVEDAHRVLMPLSLALKMSETMPVRLFFDIDGVTLLSKESENLTHEGFEKGSRELIVALLASENATVHICPMCMKAAGMTSEDLLDGVEIANPETFTGFTTGRIVTLDW